VLLATSLVANLQLIAAAAIWTHAVHISGTGLQPESLALIVSHAAGALIANVVSVTVFVAETLMLRR
jgi:hypothetical protein